MCSPNDTECRTYWKGEAHHLHIIIHVCMYNMYTSTYSLICSGSKPFRFRRCAQDYRLSTCAQAELYDKLHLAPLVTLESEMSRRVQAKLHHMHVICARHLVWCLRFAFVPTYSPLFIFTISIAWYIITVKTGLFMIPTNSAPKIYLASITFVVLLCTRCLV